MNLRSASGLVWVTGFLLSFEYTLWYGVMSWAYCLFPSIDERLGWAVGLGLAAWSRHEAEHQ